MAGAESGMMTGQWGHGVLYRSLASTRIGSDIWRCRHQLELRQTLTAVAIAGAVAVASRVTTADDDDVFVSRHDLIVELIALVDLVLLRQEFHRVMDSFQFTTRDGLRSRGCVAPPVSKIAS